MKKNVMRWVAVVWTVCLLLGIVPAFADTPQPNATGEVISQKVSLRVDHAIGATLVQSLNNGDTFEILDRWEDWLYIAYFDAEKAVTVNGWLLDTYVVENPIHITLRNSNTAAYAYPSSDSKKVGSLVKYTRLTVIAELDKYWVVSLREAAACIRKSASVWLDEELAAYSTVLGQGTVLNKTKMRTGPGTKWDTVATLAVGTPLSILGEDGDWYVVSYDNTFIAYVMKADVTY